MRVKIQPFAIANWLHAAPAGCGSQAGYFHSLDRCREAFEPFGMIGILENGRLESPDGIWSAHDVPAHCYRVLA